MRLSRLNIKKINLNDIDSNYSGQDILMKLGELYQFESGIYGYGNLWTKLERIVENIIIEELDKAGCIQVEFPKLQPRKIWDQSNRWDTYTKDGDIMFTINNNLGEYGLAPTAEEFQAITNLGEDKTLYDEKNDIGINKEVLEFDNKDEYFKQLGVTDVTNLREYSTVELGNNFQLGTKYSDSMGLFYMDENNEKKPYYMGCYGIGLGRIIACLIENNVIKENDKIKGFALPYDIAPYKVQIIYNENNKEEGEKLYNYLLQNNINAIIDDRENLNIGNRINDVYVLGTPKMIILGTKFDGTNYEVEDTKTNKKEIVNIDNIINILK